MRISFSRPGPCDSAETRSEVHDPCKVDWVLAAVFKEDQYLSLILFDEFREPSYNDGSDISRRTQLNFKRCLT